MLRKCALSLIILSVLLAAVIPVFSQDDMTPVKMRSIEGQVTTVDVFGPRIIVSCNTGKRNDQTTFTLSKNCNIIKGGVKIGLSNVYPGDHVEVQYYATDFGGFKATYIRVGR